VGFGLCSTGLPSRESVDEWLRAAVSEPANLPDEGYEALLGANGSPLEELCELADALRQQSVGASLTYVVNRNLDTAAVAGSDSASRERLSALVLEACELGATEICMQGSLPATQHDNHLELIRAIKAAASGIHLHAFRPPELLEGALRCELGLDQFLMLAKAAGLGSFPGTAARILDDEVRARMKGGADLPVSKWIAVVEAAHRAGLPSSSTMVFGHVETRAQQVAHLRRLASIQDRTGGFSEFIAMPFVPAAAALSAPGIAGQNTSGPTWRETRAIYAVARLMLHGRIDNIQAAWPKFGLDASVELLRGGANDLGGLLLDGHLAPVAGAEAGITLTRDDLKAVAEALNRPLRQRTTTYGEVAASA